MKIKFSQLEQARKNPIKFGEKYSSSGGFFNSKNFKSYLSLATRRFHQGMSKAQALQFFSDKCNNNLTLQHHYQARFNHYKNTLSSYCDLCNTQNGQFVEAQKPIVLYIGNHIVSGKIERFDLRPIGYRVTGTLMDQMDWESELRWPLMQKAVAEDFNCPLSEVEVGIFCY